MLIYIAIDDTDNHNTRGTGYRARMLAKELSDNNWGEITGITRHQLFVSKDIPYTSHNSSLCIGLYNEYCDMDELIKLCSEFLIRECAEGSDPGLCISESIEITDEIIAFGNSAKCEVLKQQKAAYLAEKFDIHLSGHGGTNDGIIGALAAVGLRKSGNDGRFVWLKGIRDMEGVYSAREILEKSGVERIVTEDGLSPEMDDMVDVGDWFRPVMLKGVPTLLVSKVSDTKGEWRILERSRIKERY